MKKNTSDRQITAQSKKSLQLVAGISWFLHPFPMRSHENGLSERYFFVLEHGENHLRVLIDQPLYCLLIGWADRSGRCDYQISVSVSGLINDAFGLRGIDRIPVARAAEIARLLCDKSVDIEFSCHVILLFLFFIQEVSIFRWPAWLRRHGAIQLPRL